MYDLFKKAADGTVDLEDVKEYIHPPLDEEDIIIFFYDVRADRMLATNPRTLVTTDIKYLKLYKGVHVLQSDIEYVLQNIEIGVFWIIPVEFMANKKNPDLSFFHYRCLPSPYAKMSQLTFLLSMSLMYTIEPSTVDILNYVLRNFYTNIPISSVPGLFNIEDFLYATEMKVSDYSNEDEKRFMRYVKYILYELVSNNIQGGPAKIASLVQDSILRDDFQFIMELYYFEEYDKKRWGSLQLREAIDELVELVEQKRDSVEAVRTKIDLIESQIQLDEILPKNNDVLDDYFRLAILEFISRKEGDIAQATKLMRKFCDMYPATRKYTKSSQRLVSKFESIFNKKFTTETFLEIKGYVNSFLNTKELMRAIENKSSWNIFY